MGDLGNKLSGFLWGLIKLRKGEDKLHRIAVVEVLWPLNGGEVDPCDTLIQVQRRVYKSAAGGLWVTNIQSIMGMAYLIPYRDGQWLVNNHIDLKISNDIYTGLGNVV